MQNLAQTSWITTPGDGLGTAYSTLQVSQILNAQTVYNGTVAIRPGGIRRTRARIIHTDKSLTPIQDLTQSVQRVTLTFDGTASITRSCEMQFRKVPGPYGGQLGQFTRGAAYGGGAQQTIDVYHDRCLIYIDVGAPDGGWLSWQVGVFLWSIPEDTITPSSRSNVVQLHDYAQFLLDQKFQTPQILYGISDGRAYGDNYIGLNPSEAIDNGVLGLLAQAGFYEGGPYPAPNIVPVAATIIQGYGPITATNQGLDVTWPWGTTFLKAINDNLAANSYYPLWFDHTGTPTSSPILPTVVTGTYTTPAPSYSYTTDPTISYNLPNGTETALCILPPIVSRADQSNLANVVQVSSDDPLSPVGYIARNYSPSNPISTSMASDPTSIAGSNAGRDIFKLVTDNNLTSADVAYYRAQVETIRAAAVYHQISLNTILHPALEAHDWVQVYAGNDPGNDVSGTGELISFIMEIRVGSPNNIGTALQSGGVANATNQTVSGGAVSLRYMTQTIQIVQDLNAAQPSILFTGLGNPAAPNHQWVLGTAIS